MLERLVEIRGPIDVDMYDAFEMREHRHARLALHPINKALAAARHDDVERSAEAVQHFADRFARSEGRARDRGLGQACLPKAVEKAGADGAENCENRPSRRATRRRCRS